MSAVTRTSRTRGSNYAVGPGSYQRSLNGGASWTTHGPSSIDTNDACSDYHGLPYVDSYLLITKDRYNPPRVNGTTPSGTLRGKWQNNVPYLWALEGTYPAHLDAKSALGNYIPTGGDAANLAARSNPSRPIVDVPQLVFELRELPGLIRWTGQNLLSKKGWTDALVSKKISGSYLAWNFGVAPLIGDLMKLWDFAALVEKRIALLNRLYKKGIRSKHELGGGIISSGSYGPGLISYDGGGLSIQGSATWVSSYRVWGSIEWKPDSPLPPPSEVVRQRALRAAYGGVLDLALIWEITPWSWLVDWCTSIGDYLDANRNVVGASPSRINIMVHSKAEVTYSVTSKPSYVTVSGSSNKTVFERKRRKADLMPGLSATLPFLSGRQLGILSALTIQKLPRSALRRFG